MGQGLPLIAEMKMIGDLATAYACENFTCQLPTNDLRKFESLLGAGGTTRPAP